MSAPHFTQNRPVSGVPHFVQKLAILNLPIIGRSREIVEKCFRSRRWFQMLYSQRAERWLFPIAPPVSTSTSFRNAPPVVLEIHICPSSFAFSVSRRME